MIPVLPRDPAATENHRLTMSQLSLCLPGLSPVQEKEIVARFDGGRLSSDGGVVLLREIEARLGLSHVGEDERLPLRMRLDAVKLLSGALHGRIRLNHAARRQIAENMTAA